MGACRRTTDGAVGQWVPAILLSAAKRDNSLLHSRNTFCISFQGMMNCELVKRERDWPLKPTTAQLAHRPSGDARPSRSAVSSQKPRQARGRPQVRARLRCETREPKKKLGAQNF